MQRQRPQGRVRGTIVTLGEFLTLDIVLAGYEQKRKQGDPEFCEPPNRASGDGVVPDSATFTPRQGQFLAFLHYYTKLNRQPPSERDFELFFKTSPSAVHQMIVTLEERGLIRRTPGMARSIRPLVPRERLPDLE